MHAMKNWISFYIGTRYLRAKRQNNFISFVSLFAFLGMALGVFALIVVLSVMNGFDSELKQRILRVVPHGFITKDNGIAQWQTVREQIQTMPNVRGSAPYIEGNGLVSYDGVVHGLQLQGTLPEFAPEVSDVADHMLVGRIDQLQARSYNIILGVGLARYLNLNIGDKVNVLLPRVSVTPAGVFPRSKRFTVVGVFEVGAQLDQNLALVHLTDAQKLFRKGHRVDGIQLRFDDIYHAPKEMNIVKQSLGSEFSGKDWSQTQGSLFQAVKMEKTVVGVMLSIIILVAAFNIVTTLIMMIAEKRSDIAVLRTMGLSAWGVVGIFLVQGIVLGAVGVFLGAFSGILVALKLPQMVEAVERALNVQIFDPTVYFVTTMPSQLHWQDVQVICLAAFFISIIASAYPAFRASQVAPAEALRYNM